MSSRLRPRASSISDADKICHFCLTDAPNTPYRAEMQELPGGRWNICNPGCPKKPPGTKVVMASNWKTDNGSRKKGR
jgi:hypothetical protein